MTRVLLAVDGSDLDQRLAEVADRLVQGPTELFAVNIDNDSVSSVDAGRGAIIGPYAVAGSVDVDDTRRQGRGTVSDSDAGRAAAAEHSPDRAVAIGAHGDVGEQIVDAAVRNDIDVIVIGHHERSWWKSLFDPSAAKDVIDRAPTPVLVVGDATARSATPTD